jgi:hypothetical protein
MNVNAGEAIVGLAILPDILAWNLTDFRLQAFSRP